MTRFVEIVKTACRARFSRLSPCIHRDGALYLFPFKIRYRVHCHLAARKLHYIRLSIFTTGLYISAILAVCVISLCTKCDISSVDVLYERPE